MGKAEEKTPKSEEFTRFRELAGKIVTVPKAEVDKQREKYERKKEQKERRPIGR